MATRSADVNLIIRAKTEGEKAISSMADAVAHLINGAGTGNKELAEFGRTILALDKAAAGLASAQEKVGNSASAQATAIHAASAGIAEQHERVETLRRGLGILAAEADKAFVGPKRNGLTDLLRLAKSELSDAERSLNRFTASYDRNLAALQTSRSGLLDLKRSTIETGDAQATAAAQVELTTQAMERQTAEARRAAAAQTFFNNKGAPALTRGPATDNGATFDALIEHFQRLNVEAAKVRQAIDPVSVAVERYEARIADVQAAARNGIIGSDDAIIRERQLRFELTQTIDKIAEGAARIREERKNAVTEYQALINGLTGVSGQRATELGASYSALDADQQRREAAVRAREAAQLRDAANRAGGVGEPPATSAGATFSALEARALEEEAVATEKAATAKREAAHAYQMFEARVREGAAALRESEDAAARDTATIAQLEVKLDPLGTVQRRLNAELERYRELAAAGKLSTDKLAAAEAHLAEEAEQARAALDQTGDTGGRKLSLFGLKPYELQNLSYQINDVVTGLASGQHLTQIIAQQGGQILQLFPKVTGNILGALTNPGMLLLVATVGTLALSMKRAADDSERLRNATAMLNFRADGAGYDPKAVAAQEKQFERLGATAAVSRATIKAFLDESVAPDKLRLFSQAAQAASETLGESLPDAAREVATAFTGSYEAIAKFDDKLNFLTASQREHIRTLFDEGKAQQARTEALNIYVAKQQELADKSRGQFAGAARELSSAWSEFMDLLSKTGVVQDFTAALGNLAGAARVALEDLNNVGDAAGTLKEIGDVRAQIADLNNQITKAPNDSLLKVQLADRQRGLESLVKRYNDLAKAAGKAQLAADGTGGPTGAATGGTVSEDPNSPAAKQRRDDLARISREDELQRLRDAGQTRILTAQERARRAELAGQEAARNASDSVVAAAEKRRAVAHETAQIEKEADSRAKAAAADREREIRAFEGRVIGAEGGAGKNPHSTAKGYGQFTEGTFKDQFAKVFPEQSRTLSGSQVLALRSNETVAKAIIDNYARENARFLESFGAKVTAGNLYLAHFLGAGTAKAVLTSGGAVPVDQIIRRSDPTHAAQVLSGNAGYLRTEGGKGRYRTSGELQRFIAGRVGDTGQAQTEGQVAINQLLEESVRRQDAFNESVRHGIEDKQDALKYQQQENSLYGVALIAAQRRKAITDAEREQRQKAEDANKSLKPGETPVVVSQEQIDGAKELAASLFDAQHARELLNAQLADAQRPVDELTAQRDLLREQAEYLRSIGEDKQADSLDDQVRHLGDTIAEAYQKLIEFYRALSPEQQVQLGIVDQAQLDNVIGKLKHAQTATQDWGKVAGVSGKEIAQAFASSAAASFTNFINKVAAGKNVFKALGQGVREFAANFISSVAQMILQLLAYAAAVTILRALGVPIPTASILGGGGANSAPTFGGGSEGNAPGVLSLTSAHTGGVVGQGTGQRRSVSPMLFAAAMRYHTGGIVGLAPDEAAIIARKGEEVLTPGDPRHRNNAVGGGNTDRESGNLTVINVADHDAAVQQALRRPAGERVLMNFLADNKAAVKAALA